MTVADLRERQRRLRIEFFGAMQRHADRPHSDAEQRESAAAIGVSDHLPEPQEALPLKAA